MTRYGKRYSLCDLSIQIGVEETTENVGKNLCFGQKSTHLKWIIIGNNNVIFISNWCMQDNNYYIINHS